MATERIILAVTILRFAFCCEVPNITDEGFYTDVYQDDHTKLTWNGEDFDNVTWTFIPNGSNKLDPYPFLFPGHVHLQNSGRTLIIEKIPMEATGVFISTALCTRTGRTDSINITIKVNSCAFADPTITGTSNVSAKTGEPVNLHCSIELQCKGSIPGPYTSWFWNGSNVEKTSGMTVSTKRDSRTEYATTLMIREVMADHFKHPFICKVHIGFQMEKMKIFLIKMETQEEIRSMIPVASITLGVVIPVLVLILIVGALYLSLPFLKWGLMKFARSCSSKTERGNEKRRYDVFLYYNDDGVAEAKAILEFLSENGYNVLSGITPGKSKSSMRDMIEDSRSAIIIATSDEMLPSVLTETAEEIRIPNVIVLTKNQRTCQSPFLNSVQLNYPYDTLTCFSLLESRFYMKLRVNLPFPRTASENCSSKHLNDSSIACFENEAFDGSVLPHLF